MITSKQSNGGGLMFARQADELKVQTFVVNVELLLYQDYISYGVGDILIVVTVLFIGRRSLDC